MKKSSVAAKYNNIIMAKTYTPMIILDANTEEIPPMHGRGWANLLE